MADTPRLRPLTFDDWPAVHRWASMPDSCRYQAWGPNTEDDTRAHLRRAADAQLARPQRWFAHVVLLGDQVIGAADLHLRDDSNGEIGYGIHPAWWGRGLATEAAALLLDLGFGQHGRHRIYATCDPRNLGSARVLAKLGMTHEGRMRETLHIRDGWRDSDLYSILDREWRR